MDLWIRRIVGGYLPMNIQMQMGGIFILFLLLYFYKRQDTIGLYTGKVFLRALYITFSCLLLDILSIILIVNQERMPIWLVRVECKAYLFSLVMCGYIAFAYTSADIRRLTKADKFIRRLGSAVATVAVLIFVLPIHTYYDGRGVVYTYGWACYATYAGALLFILATLVEIYIWGKMMNPKRRNAIRLWLFIWVAAAVVQFLNSRLLLVGFAGVMGMVILFFELENPEIYIDRTTGFFNSYAFIEFIRQQYRTDSDCCGILVSLQHVHTINNMTSARTEQALAEIVHFIRKIPGVRVFKTDDREFALECKTQDSLDRVRDMICDRFQKSWLERSADTEPVFLQPYYLLIPFCRVAADAEEMLDVLRFYRSHVAELAEDQTITINEDIVKKRREYDKMLGTLVNAIKEDRIEVFYQPIYSIKKQKFVSAEALARIRCEDGSIIPPGAFIPIAEETGLISEVGEIMFDKTCRFIKEHDLNRYGVKYIEANVSVVQCSSETLADAYISIMKKHQLSPSCINLEITESASINMRTALLDNMKRLLDYGISFSLDDFGNGQSNLNYIVDMPVQIVKFDRDMTQAYFANEKAKFILRATMNMIHDMKLKIVSEGVETEEQFEALKELGIDYIQGYYFSKPLEAQAFLDYIKRENG